MLLSLELNEGNLGLVLCMVMFLVQSVASVYDGCAGQHAGAKGPVDLFGWVG